MPPIKRWVLVALIGVLLLPTQRFAFAFAKGARPERRAPGVVVSFEGGIVGDNMSAALREIAKYGDGIPTEVYTVQPGDSLCTILLARNFPPPCAPLARFVDSLNQKTHSLLRGIKAGDTIMLPQLQIESYRAADLSSPAAQQQEHIRRQFRSYRDLNPDLRERVPGQNALLYDAFRIYIPTKDDETANQIFIGLSPMISRNVFVDVLHSKDSPGKVNSMASESWEKIKDDCLRNNFGSEVYRYGDLVDEDSDAIDVVTKGQPKKLETVSVILIDTKLQPSPNLYPAYGERVDHGTARWKCQWADYKRGLHHATHLAGIIASQQEQFGFAGLAKNVRLESFEWVRAVGDGATVEPSRDDRDIALGEKFRDCGVCPPPLRVFLAAVDFDPFDRNKSPSEILTNADRKKNSGIGMQIIKRQPLLVVAAGQPDDEKGEPREIGKDSNMSPQAFGDLRNVIVVTACEECSRKYVKLMPTANWAREGDYTVHVAAPGGKKVPGWVSEDSISAAPGTSEAAAYVAGIVATMIGAFPNSYTNAEIVKSRIQVTSRPFPPENGDVSSEAPKLTAGVVDPVLALLDPRKHWVRDSSGWHEAASWSPQRLSVIAMNGRTKEIKGQNLLRVVKMQEGGHVTRWALYEDRAKSLEAPEPGTVGRHDLVSFSTGTTLTLCDGSTISLGAVDDFIPSIGDPKGNGCSAAP